MELKKRIKNVLSFLIKNLIKLQKLYKVITIMNNIPVIKRDYPLYL